MWMLTFIEAGSALAWRCRFGLRSSLDASPSQERPKLYRTALKTEPGQLQPQGAPWGAETHPRHPMMRLNPPKPLHEPLAGP